MPHRRSMTTHQPHARRATTLFVLTVALTLLAAACGDDDTETFEGGALTSTTAGAGAEDDQEAVNGHGDEDDHSSFAFGEPADVADASRTIEVAMMDSFEYEPPSITVDVGETVLFEVTNDGAIPHEFVLGDHDLQVDHEQEMAEMEGGMMMGDEPNAVAVAPGETKELAFTFTEPGQIEYACHEPGHYDAGMIGDLTVE